MKGNVSGDLKEEWHSIMDTETTRKRSLKELEKIVGEGSSRKQTARQLLKLIAYGKEISVSDAARILKIDKKIVKTWGAVLKKKGLIKIEGEKTENPILKADKKLVSKVRPPETLKKTKTGQPAESQEVKQELMGKTEELRRKTDELAEEQRKRRELEDRLKNVEKQMGDGVEDKGKLEELRNQLMTEREERIRVDERLKQEQEVIIKREAELREKESLLLIA